MEQSTKPQEYDFDTWTAQELFEHLIDLKQIPFEAEFENWRHFRKDMLRICKETYQNQKHDME